ncbi:MAG: CDP-diacylglycerol--glycerol-3-phosphate 3-phosphatidyltransferase [Ignavibacteria bacterium]|nr:CDP-diacylglycerol--glycerol-3-phosphate 3-phosphatidyltransferase [Ignavibacteria bacterium]
MITDFYGKNTLIILLVLCMYISDLLDGYFARKLNQVSELGKIIDPLADKISVIVISVILLLQNRIAFWFVVVVILRDLFILAFGTYLNNKKNIRLMSNYPGKIAVFSIGLILLFAITDNSFLLKLNKYLYVISISLIIYSTVLYFRRFMETVKLHE